MGSPTSGARPERVDPVEDMRRQLARLGIEVAPAPQAETDVERARGGSRRSARSDRRSGSTTKLVRSAREERDGPDVRGIRSGAGDPQRAHPIGFAEDAAGSPDESGGRDERLSARSMADSREWGSGARRETRGARRGRGSARRDTDSLSSGVGGDAGRHADPVAAGSEPGEPERRVGTRRLAPGDRPQATLEQAKDACLRLLAVRARSRAELAKRLGEKGFRLEIIEAALGRLTEVGLIDDAAFAEQWVHARHTYSGKGKKALQRELHDKGVDPADAAQALAAVTDEAEHARAADLVRRKLRTLPRDLDRDKALRRLVGMLARRGYDQSTAFTVVTTELTDAGYERTPPPRPADTRPDAAETADPPTHDPEHADPSGLRCGAVDPTRGTAANLDGEDCDASAATRRTRGRRRRDAVDLACGAVDDLGAEGGNASVAAWRTGDRLRRGTGGRARWAADDLDTENGDASVGAGRTRGRLRRDAGGQARRAADDLDVEDGDASIALRRTRGLRRDVVGAERVDDQGPDDEKSDSAVVSGTFARRAPARPVPGDEQTAVDLVRRKLRSIPADLDRAKVTRRLVDMLARRGYDLSTAYTIVRTELAEARR